MLEEFGTDFEKCPICEDKCPREFWGTYIVKNNGNSTGLFLNCCPDCYKFRFCHRPDPNEIDLEDKQMNCWRSRMKNCWNYA